MGRAGDTGDDAATEALSVLSEDLADTPYRPVGIVGRGAMGAVFEIEHRLLGRRLVLKVLRASNRPDLEDRLRFEAQTLAQLSHPNLLEVVDFGRTRSGRPYLVTELLAGQTMKELLGSQGFLAVHEACLYVKQALSGIASAHRAGVIHRDIKTDNLFVCDGRVGEPPVIKVIDFGIAKIAEAEDVASQVKVDPLEVPTAEGVMVGTPSFMSPEQIFAQKVDARTDLFSMGMVLYRLVAGRGPFQHRDVLKTVESNAREEAEPPSRFATQPIPPELDALVLRAIAKRREDRFQSAKEMAEALEPLLGAVGKRSRFTGDGLVTLIRMPAKARDLDAPTLRDLAPPQGMEVEPATDVAVTAKGTVRMAPSGRRGGTVPLAIEPRAVADRGSVEPAPSSGASAPSRIEVRSGRKKLLTFLIAISLAAGATVVVFRFLGWA